MKVALSLLIAFSTPALYAYDTSSIAAQKAGCRHEIIRRALPRNFTKIASPIRDNDRAENLISNPLTMVKNIRTMDEQNLQSGKTLSMPWSDSYWPISQGGISQRYQDEKFSRLSWKDARDYVTRLTAEDLISRGKWNKLSPAEKYDFLFELKGFPLTESSWEEGLSYFSQYGSVESWMGYCHGWSAASIMTQEPRKKVAVETSAGKGIFYPSDIKALNTYLWSNGNFPTKFIGGRCNDKSPEERESDCIDNNPGTWHLTVVNQIGISKRSFIMDASSGYEVWNHPVYSYEYTYMNPKTGIYTKNLAEAIAKRGTFEDKKEKFRSRDAEYIVGIAMTVHYAVENSPSTGEDQEVNTSANEFLYDLELNTNYSIVGGEWDSDSHPDFMWIPVEGSYPRTSGDNGDLDLTFNNNIPANVKSSALVNARQGLPYGPIVRSLVKKSAR